MPKLMDSFVITLILIVGTNRIQCAIILDFIRDISKSWGLEDMTFIDVIGIKTGSEKLVMMDFMRANPLLPVRFLSSENIKGDETVSQLLKTDEESQTVNVQLSKMLDNIHQKGAVIIGNTNPNLLKTVSQGLLERMTWLVPAEMNISGIKLKLDSNLYLYSLVKDSINIFEAYAIKDGPQIKRRIGNWTPNEGIYIEEPNVWERRRDLSNVTILDATFLILYRPTLLAEITNNGLEVTGYFPEMLNLLSEELQFKIEHVLPPDKSGFGVRNINRTWNGLVGLVSRREADVSTGSLSITMEREEVVDFTIPLFQLEITIIMKKSSMKNAVTGMAYAHTFTVWTWLAILIFLLILPMGMILIGNASPLEKNQGRNSFGISNIFDFVYISLLQHDSHIVMSGYSTRMLEFTTCMFLFLIYANFTAVIISFLTIYEPQPEITSFQDVLDKGYDVVTLKDTTFEMALTTAKPPSILYDIYTKNMKGRPNSVMHKIPDILDELDRNPMTVFFAADNLIYNSNNLVALKLPGSISYNAAICLQKDSEFKKIFDYFLEKLMQDGIMRKVRDKWFNLTNTDFTSVSPITSEPVSFFDMILPGLILFVGIGVSLVVIILEIVKKKLLAKKKTKVFPEQMREVSADEM